LGLQERCSSPKLCLVTEVSVWRLFGARRFFFSRSCAFRITLGAEESRDMAVFIGTSGWNYKGWAGGVFYPSGLKSAAWLDYYAARFNSVEVNNTFYRLPEKRVFTAWHDRTPDHFVFAVKVSRFITHMKKLLDPEQHVSLFLERASGLQKKLGVLLFQLPPTWRFNGGRLEALFEFVEQQRIVPGVRVALEVRHASWLGELCLGTLRRFNVALALADWPTLKVWGPVTADFTFVRRHGPEGLYSSDYSEEHLRRDAHQIREWSTQGRDVYAYYNNDAYGFAVKNALGLKERVEK
jgi:uncharacterized protein YecE (DUF72 family)